MYTSLFPSSTTILVAFIQKNGHKKKILAKLSKATFALLLPHFFFISSFFFPPSANLQLNDLAPELHKFTPAMQIQTQARSPNSNLAGLKCSIFFENMLIMHQCATTLDILRK